MWLEAVEHGINSPSLLISSNDIGNTAQTKLYYAILHFIKYTAAVFSQRPYWLVESISCNVRLWFPLYPSEFWKAPNKTVGAKVGLIFDISKLKELSWKNLLYYKTLQYSTKQYIAVNNRNYTVGIILSNVKSVYFTTGNCRLFKQYGKLRREIYILLVGFT